jgi:hypothetical protein
VNKQRKQAQDFILEYIEKLCPGGENVQMYQALFDTKSDEEFDTFMKDLKSGKVKLAITAPNFGKSNLTTARNLELAKELKHNFFQRVWIPAKDGSPSYLSPIPYLVVDLPLRRQAQLLSKKISIPEDNNSVDDFTGQPTGKSKGSRVSYPEINILAALGLNKGLEELLKYRGGDEKGFNAMNTMIDRTGGVSMKAIEPYASGVKSTATLGSFLKAMHLNPTGL